MAASTATLTIARVRTLAFLGLDVADVDVEVQLSSGLPSFTIVGLADKAVAESRERVRAALSAMGLTLPPRRIIVNLAPADLAKEGSHFDLPVALGLLIVMGVLPVDTVEQHLVLGELALDGGIRGVAGVLPAAVAAAERGLGLICPGACGAEAAWLKDQVEILAAPSLLALINHARGTQLLTPPEPVVAEDDGAYPDLRDVKGQETAKRALEIAAAGAHNLMLIGPPGAGKSMLAARLIGILPPLDPGEVLEVSMIASIGGRLEGGRLSRRRPFRSPHHAASTAAMVGGGSQARPGEISLAHLGVLFLDELPEFGRAGAGIAAPAAGGRPDHGRPRPGARDLSRPVPAGGRHEPLPLRASGRRGPGLPAGAALRGRLSGADLRPAARPHRPACRGAAAQHRRHGAAGTTRGLAEVAARVAAARLLQADRLAGLGRPELRTNSEADGELLEAAALCDEPARGLLRRAAQQLHLSARGYHRVLKVARSIADLDGSETIRKPHIAEAVAFRRVVRARS